MTGDLAYTPSRTTVAIKGVDHYRSQQLSELAAICQCEVVASDIAADYLLTDVSSISSQTSEHYSEIADYLHQYGAEALVWIRMDQLDEAFSTLPCDWCHFLVDSDDAMAVPILGGLSRRVKMNELNDRNREGDYLALHKVSDELAQLSRTLARLAEQEGASPSALRDKPVSFRPAPADIFEPQPQPAPHQGSPTASTIRDLIKLRRMREQHFPAGLFADPGWDILLDLFAAKLEGRTVSVSSLCIAAAVPPTTGLRWITTMTEHGALVRRQDPNDARRVFIELSDDSENRLRSFFSQAATKGGLPI